MTRGPRTPTLLLALLFAATTAPAGAWGPTGHRVVAQIATDHLSDAARREVRDLLGTSLVEASTWADDIRSDPKWKWLEPYHYADLDPRVGRFERCPRKGCLVDGIRRALDRLRDRSTPRDERADALRQLVHFVGDLHQPLHVAHAADRGGNAVDVRWFGRPSNLHWVWDTGIVREAFGRSWRGIATRIEDDLVTDSAIASWSSGSLIEWIEETYRLSVDVVYPSVARDRNLGREYAATHADLVETQLAKGGVRLASMLNEIWP